MQLPPPRWTWAHAGGPEPATDAGGPQGNPTTPATTHAVPTARLPRPATGQDRPWDRSLPAACGLVLTDGRAAPEHTVRRRCADCWQAVFDRALVSLGPEGIVLAYHHAGCSPAGLEPGGVPTTY